MHFFDEIYCFCWFEDYELHTTHNSGWLKHTYDQIAPTGHLSFDLDDIHMLLKLVKDVNM